MFSVRNAAILCLHAVEVRNTAPSVDSIHLGSVLVSSLFNVLAVYVSSSDRVSTLRPLRPCLKSQTAQALSQVSDSSGRVSSLRSCFDFNLRFAALRSIMRQSEEWDVYRESSASCILVIKLVTYEISYIQPIHWWDFRSQSLRPHYVTAPYHHIIWPIDVFEWYFSHSAPQLLCYIASSVLGVKVDLIINHDKSRIHVSYFRR